MIKIKHRKRTSICLGIISISIPLKNSKNNYIEYVTYGGFYGDVASVHEAKIVIAEIKNKYLRRLKRGIK